jgi:hypothetical protein
MRVTGGRLNAVAVLQVGRIGLSSGSKDALLVRLAGILLFLLAALPFLSDLLEFCSATRISTCT